MQLTHRRRHHAQTQLNLPAMIDVVFLLLIFFICTSSFRPPENELPSQLPRVGMGTTASDEDFDPVKITLSSVADGVLVRCDGQVCATFDKLRDMLRARRAIADVRVLIEGQDDVPFRYMVAAMDVCRQVKLTRVAFAVAGGTK